MRVSAGFNVDAHRWWGGNPIDGASDIIVNSPPAPAGHPADPSDSGYTTMALVWGFLEAGSSISGELEVTMALETAGGSIAWLHKGSFIKYKELTVI